MLQPDEMRLLLRRAAWLIIALAGMAISAEAQTEGPSDLELDAAYCLGIGLIQIDPLVALLETDHDPDCKGLPRQDYVALCRKGQQMGRDLAHAEKQDFQRLQSYIIAKGYGKIQYKTVPDLMAINRGKADATDWMAKVNSPTYRECVNHCLFPSDCAAQCIQQFDTDGLGGRMGRCQGILQALPF